MPLRELMMIRYQLQDRQMQQDLHQTDDESKWPTEGRWDQGMSTVVV